MTKSHNYYKKSGNGHNHERKSKLTVLFITFKVIIMTFKFEIDIQNNL